MEKPRSTILIPNQYHCTAYPKTRLHKRMIRTRPNKFGGFNLIELLITLAIMGILLAIAIPGYRNYVIKSSRSAAQTELIKLANTQEKIYLNSSAFSASVTAAYNGNSTGGLGITSGTTTDGKYTFAIPSSGQTFTITARPTAGTNQVGNGCLTIQDNGLRQWYQSSDSCSGTATAW